MESPLPAYVGDAPYVFVSYSHADIELVYPEICWLQAHGFNVWWDEGISPGSTWRQELAQALRGGALILYFVTPNSANSSQCVREINFGMDDYQRPVVAVHLVETKLPDSLSLSLSDRQAILQHQLSAEDYERKIATVIAGYLSQPVPDYGSIKRTSGRRRSQPWIALFVMFIVTITITAGATWWLATSGHASQKEVTFEFELPAGITLSSEDEHDLDISPDGKDIFVIGVAADGGKRLYHRGLDDTQISIVNGAEASAGEILRSVFIAPNGLELGLTYTGKDTGLIKRIPATGGTPITVAEVDSHFIIRAHWSADDYIAYRGVDAIWQVPLRRSVPTRLINADNEHPGVSTPFYTPDGEGMLITRRRTDGIFDIVHSSLVTGTQTLLVEDAGDAKAVSPNRIFFSALTDGVIWAANMNSDYTALAGDPVIVLEDVAGGNIKHYAIAEDGTLVYRQQVSRVGQQFVWADRAGTQRPLDIPPQSITNARISPDQTRITFSNGPLNGSNLWIISLNNRLQSRVLARPSIFSPIWSPDSTSIVFSEFKPPRGSVGLVDLRKSNRAQDLSSTDVPRAYISWTPDKQALLFQQCASVSNTGEISGCDIGAMPIASPDTARLLLATDFNERYPMISPDGGFVAYLTDEFGTDRIVVRSYPNVEAAYWQVPEENCKSFYWSANGSEIVSHCGNTVISIPVSRDKDTLFLGKAETLFSLDTGTLLADVTADGQGFLLIKDTNAGTNKLVVVLNWLDEVDRLLAGGAR